MKHTVNECSHNGQVQSMLKTLTDDSRVPTIAITSLTGDDIHIDCIDTTAAAKLMRLLSNEDDYLIR